MKNVIPFRWPDNWPRIKLPVASDFSGDLTLSNAVTALVSELSRPMRKYLGAFAQNIRVAVERSKTASEHGAAVYFDRYHLPPAPAPPVLVEYALACDTYDRNIHNVWALFQHVKAIRTIERHGVGTLTQALAGYAQLPPSPDAKPYVEPVRVGSWRATLGFTPQAKPSREQVIDAHRALILKHHPDRGGDSMDAATLNAARDDALTEPYLLTEET